MTTKEEYEAFEKYPGRKVYCVMSSSDRFDELTKGITIMRPAVDRVVVVCNNSGKYLRWTEEQLTILHNLGAETYLREWNGNFPEARNYYLSKCQIGDWIIVSDSDEHFCDEFPKKLNWVFAQMVKRGAIYGRINSHDVTYPFGWKTGDPEPVELTSEHMKLLIFKYMPGIHYEGAVGIQLVHEGLKPDPDPKKVTDLPKFFYYRHIKLEQDIWARAARNVWHTGGGNDVGGDPDPKDPTKPFNPYWKALRALSTELGFDNWYDFEHYLKLGNIDSRVRDWILAHRQKGMDYENEMCDFFRYYFFALHPEEKPEGVDVISELIPGSLAETLQFVEGVYMQILGRHPSFEEKFLYAKHLMDNRVRREDMEKIFKESPEYRQKNPLTVEKTVPNGKGPQDTVVEKLPVVNIPVNVEVSITPNIIDQTLRHSKYYNEYMRFLVEFGKRWMVYNAVNYKVETDGKGDDKQPKEQFEKYKNDVITLIPPNQFPRMLDVGAGAGDEAAVFQDAGFTVIGLTLGEDNIKHAKDTYGITLLEQDMHCLPFPKDYFDCAAIIHTYEHSFAPMMLLGELYYTLRDYGRVYVAVPDPEAPESKTIWHTNLKYPGQILADFLYWGFRPLDFKEKSPIESRDKYTFIFEKLPKGHPDFTNWGYLQHVYHLREGLL